MAKKIVDAINNATQLPEPIVADKTVQKISDAIRYVNDRYKFKFNVVTADLEFKVKGGGEFRIIQDRDIRNIRMELALRGLKLSIDDLRDLVYSKYVSTSYHPFREYFDSLEPCKSKFKYDDGRLISVEGKDYIREFCDQIYLKNESLRNYLVEGFRKWFVGLVVSIYDDEISMYKINQICFVLVSGQGKYKTTFFEHILPKQFRNDYFYSGSFNFHDKDNERRMGTKIIMSMEEMASYTKTDIEIVKAKITQPRIVVRPAFARADVRLKRRVSFCGTQNNKEFLKDDTGSRRFFVVEIDRVVLDNDFPVDKMFAQGLQHYRDGFRYWLDANELNEIEEINEAHQLHTFEYELLTKYYEVPEDDYEGSLLKYVTATDIAVKLAKDNNVNVNNTVIKNIGLALARLGFKRTSKRINGKAQYFWVVKEKISTENWEKPDIF
jgi:predicted P-loop ATPase